MAGIVRPSDIDESESLESIYFAHLFRIGAVSFVVYIYFIVTISKEFLYKKNLIALNLLHREDTCNKKVTNLPHTSKRIVRKWFTIIIENLTL